MILMSEKDTYTSDKIRVKDTDVKTPSPLYLKPYVLQIIPRCGHFIYPFRSTWFIEFITVSDLFRGLDRLSRLRLKRVLSTGRSRTLSTWFPLEGRVNHGPTPPGSFPYWKPFRREISLCLGLSRLSIFDKWRTGMRVSTPHSRRNVQIGPSGRNTDGVMGMFLKTLAPIGWQS